LDFFETSETLLLARAAVWFITRSKGESECHFFQSFGIYIIELLFHNTVLFYGVPGIQAYR
jgi:hypothetical protein